MLGWASQQLERLSQTVAPPPTTPSARFTYCVQRNDEAGAMGSIAEFDPVSTVLNPTKGTLCIHLACEYSMTRLIELLLSQPGQSVEVVDLMGNTPLHYAASSQAGAAFEVCKMLVAKYHACVMTKNKNGQTPYDLATLNAIRQWLLPLQLQKETQQALDNGGQGLPPGIDLGGLRIKGGPSQPPPPMGFGMSSTPPVSMGQPPSNSTPIASAPASMPAPHTKQSDETGYARVGSSSAAIYQPKSSNFIRPDGFHSSSSDVNLQKKYGHVSSGVSAVPPPPSSGGGPPIALQGGSNPFAAGVQAMGKQRYGAIPPMNRRYVAYDAVTNTTMAPPPAAAPRSYPFAGMPQAAPNVAMFTPTKSAGAPAAMASPSSEPFPNAAAPGTQTGSPFTSQPQAFQQPGTAATTPPMATGFQQSAPMQGAAGFQQPPAQVTPGHQQPQPFQQPPSATPSPAQPVSGFQQPQTFQQPQAATTFQPQTAAAFQQQPHVAASPSAATAAFQQASPAAAATSPAQAVAGFQQSQPFQQPGPIASQPQVMASYSQSQSTGASPFAQQPGATAAVGGSFHQQPQGSYGQVAQPQASIAQQSPGAGSPGVEMAGKPPLIRADSAEELFATNAPADASGAEGGRSLEGVAIPKKDNMQRVQSAEELFASPSSDAGANVANADSNVGNTIVSSPSAEFPKSSLSQASNAEDLFSSPEPKQVTDEQTEQGAGSTVVTSSTENAVAGSGPVDQLLSVPDKPEPGLLDRAVMERNVSELTAMSRPGVLDRAVMERNVSELTTASQTPGSAAQLFGGSQPNFTEPVLEKLSEHTESAQSSQKTNQAVAGSAAVSISTFATTSTQNTVVGSASVNTPGATVPSSAGDPRLGSFQRNVSDLTGAGGYFGSLQKLPEVTEKTASAQDLFAAPPESTSQKQTSAEPSDDAAGSSFETEEELTEVPLSPAAAESSKGDTTAEPARAPTSGKAAESLFAAIGMPPPPFSAKR